MIPDRESILPHVISTLLDLETHLGSYWAVELHNSSVHVHTLLANLTALVTETVTVLIR